MRVMENGQNSNLFDSEFRVPVNLLWRALSKLG